MGLLKKFPVNARAAFISALFSAFPFVVFFGSKGIVVLLILLSFGLIGFSFSEKHAWKPNVNFLTDPAFIGCVSFFSLSLISAFWSPDFAVGIKSAIRAFLVMVFGMASLWSAQSLRDEEVKTILKVLVGATLFLFIAFTIEGFREGATLKEVFHKKRGFNTLYKGFALIPLLVWPVMLVVAKKKNTISWPIVMLTLIAAFPVLYVSPMKASMLAYGVSVVVFFAIYIWPKLTHLVKVGVIISGFIFPFLMVYLGNPDGWSDAICKLPGSWQHRVYIWHYASENIMQNLWFGWGSGVSAHLNHNFNFYYCMGVTDQGRILDDPWFTDLLFHPHNGYLQVWLELGLIGIAVYSTFLLTIFHLGKKFFHDRLYFAGFNATVTAFVVIFSVSFGLWENWWLASLFWLGFIWVLLSRYQKIN